MNAGLDLYPFFAIAPMLVVVGIVFWTTSEMRKLRQIIENPPVVARDTQDLDMVMKQLHIMVQDRADTETLNKTNLDVAGALSSQDRLQLARLVALMNALDSKVDLAASAAASVAHDLAASHVRANAADGPSGAAADAASKTA